MDNIISSAMYELEQLGIRLGAGHEGVCLLMTRGVCDYMELNPLHMGRVETCMNHFDNEVYKRVNGYDVCFVLLDEADRLNIDEHFIKPAIKENRVTLDEVRDDDLVVWDDEIFRRENGVLRSTRAITSRDYRRAPECLPTPYQAHRANTVLADEMTTDEFVDFAVVNGLEPHNIDFDTIVATQTAHRIFHPGTGQDMIEVGAADYNGWTMRYYVPTTTAETVTVAANATGTETLGVAFDWDVDTFFVEDVKKVKSKREKDESELKRSRTLDDFIDQYAPKN